MLRTVHTTHQETIKRGDSKLNVRELSSRYRWWETRHTFQIPYNAPGKKRKKCQEEGRKDSKSSPLNEAFFKAKTIQNDVLITCMATQLIVFKRCKNTTRYGKKMILFIQGYQTCRRRQVPTGKLPGKKWRWRATPCSTVTNLRLYHLTSRAYHNQQVCFLFFSFFNGWNRTLLTFPPTTWTRVVWLRRQTTNSWTPKKSNARSTVQHHVL